MTILVTGATGYIGSRVVLQLAKRNLEIVAADVDMGKNKDKLKEKYTSEGNDLNLLKFEKLDITNFQNIELIFEKYKFDSVINLAYGIGMICEDNPLLASKINIVGTTSIFEMIVKYKIRRLIIIFKIYSCSRSFKDICKRICIFPIYLKFSIKLINCLS